MKRLSCVFLLAFIACTSTKNEDANRSIENASTTNDFQSFVAILPELQLPFEVNCEKCCQHAKVDDERVQKFIPEGSALVGLLGKTSKHAILLVTYPADFRVPSVIVFDMEGNRVYERNFMTSYCGGDEDFYASQFLTINKDLKITTYDTVFNLKRDSIKYEVIDTTSVQIEIGNFLINNNGVVVQVDTLIKRLN
jgi:hypothetical protein